MNVLISSGHPAQIHNFRNLKTDLESRGHAVFWIASDKDISKKLLKSYDINCFLLQKPGKKTLNKIYLLLKNLVVSAYYLHKYKIDIAVSRVSPHIAVAAFLSKKLHVALTDTESAGLYDNIFGRLASAVMTSKSFKRTLRKDQIRFDGNIELFYLHPQRFTPEPDIYDLLGLKSGDPYVIMRFVSWDAYHDKGLSGFTDANKIKAVREFSRYAKVFISAEKDLPAALEPYKITIPPEKMHDALAYANLFFGESATMASESAVLGTPAIYLDQLGRGYTDEESTYGLVFHYNDIYLDQEKAIAKGCQLLADPHTSKLMAENRQRFLAGKIDVTAFLVWFIENYPESRQIIRDNPDYQYTFK